MVSRVVGTVLCILATTAVVEGSGSRVLFINPISAKSHTIFYWGIINALADHGNQVTLVTPFSSSHKRTNVKEVVVQDIDMDVHIPNVFQGHRLSVTLKVAEAAPVLCSDALAQINVQNLLKEEFDIVIISIFFADCFLSMVHQLKVPFILVTPGTRSGWLANMIGSPQFPSFMGSLLLGYKHPLSFTQRAQSTFTDIYFDFLMQTSVTPKIEAECRRRDLCLAEMPSLLTMKYNSSLMLLNSVRSVEAPGYPTLPTEVYIGAIHCQPAKPLPKDLSDWVEEAGEAGFIFFSLGSNIQPSLMPEEYRLMLVQVLGSLKQRVLWKWDQGTMDDLPHNIRLQKWLPQQDILGDPRLRLFITHGGLLSLQEAAYNGVPVLGLPFFADQHNNMQDIHNKGCGHYLIWFHLTLQAFSDTISQILDDEKMRMIAKERARVMRDQPQDPAEVANYWVNYVIRHRGAVHLRSPALTMPWYRVYNVDVWLMVVVVVLASLYILYKLMKMLCNCICYYTYKHKQD